VIAVLLMSTKSQFLSVIFHTLGRVDVEPPSVADNLRDRAAASPRAYRAAVDAAVDDLESEVVEVFFSGLCERSSRNNFPQTLIAGRIDSFSSFTSNSFACRIWTLTVLVVESC
jgi:hypothetical protein